MKSWTLKQNGSNINRSTSARASEDAKLIAAAGSVATRLVEAIKPNEANGPGQANGKASLLERALAAAGEVEQRLAEQKARIAYLENLTLTDEMTGLMNRRGFLSQLRRALAGSKRSGDLGVLVFCDLDNFKAINDTYGHAIGDDVLRQTAKILASNLRETDIVGRLGGDEFAVLMTQTSWRDGFKRAQGLNRIINRTVVNCADKQIQLYASFGVEPFGPHDEEKNLVARADMAMYCNKRKKASIAFVSAAE